MIVPTDIESIVLGHCEDLGIAKMLGESPTVDDKTGDGLQEETVVVHVHTQTEEAIWEPCFVDVNLCVPDYKSGNAKYGRLRELERAANRLSKDGITGEYDGSHYYIQKESIGREQDKPLRCHYVNLKLKFNTLNV